MSKPFDFNHPGYLGVAKELEPSDHRLATYQEQLDEQGFDTTYLWDLDIVLSKFLGKLLVAASINNRSYPAHINTLEEWQALLRKHGQAFVDYLELVKEEDETETDELFYVRKDANMASVKQAYQFLAEYAGTLWD